MGLLPRTRNHFESAEMLLEGMAPRWKEGSIFRISESRLARYEGNLQNAIKVLSDHPVDTTLRGYNMRLRNLMVDELGWCLMLNGQYDKAAPCFDSVLKVIPDSYPIFERESLPMISNRPTFDSHLKHIKI